MNRRQMLAASSAAATAAIMPLPGFAEGRRLHLISATVLAMDGQPARAAEVLIEGDRIIEVGAVLDGTGADRLDLAGTLLIPGFVDTHWHMWNTIARGLGQTDLCGFAKSMAPLAAAWTANSPVWTGRRSCVPTILSIR